MKMAEVGNSCLELLPAEVMRMVVLEMTPADTLSFRLVSKTANAALRKPDGAYLHVLDWRSTGPDNPFMEAYLRDVEEAGLHKRYVDKSYVAWLGVGKAMHCIERGWHRDQLASLFCKSCEKVMASAKFPDSERGSAKCNRRCLGCGFTRYDGKPSWFWNSVTVGGIFHNCCSIRMDVEPCRDLHIIPSFLRQNQIRRYICNRCKDQPPMDRCFKCNGEYPVKKLLRIPDCLLSQRTPSRDYSVRGSARSRYLRRHCGEDPTYGNLPPKHMTFAIAGGAKKLFANKVRGSAKSASPTERRRRASITETKLSQSPWEQRHNFD